jgi:Tol biopolymer transport system component
VFAFLCETALSQPAQPNRAPGCIQPALSPDGTTIAVSLHGAIGVMPASGGVLTRFTQGDGWDVEPAWSPDSQTIAFIRAAGFNLGPLRLIRAKDGSTISLPKDVLAGGRLQFHPDGSRMLGNFASSGQADRLQWLDLRTGELTPINLIAFNSFQRSSMDWALSPDGTTIVLATSQDRPGEQTGNNGPSTDLWRLPASGGEARPLAKWPSRIYGLCWDPNGRGLFVVTDRGVACNDVWHIPTDRSLEGARKITSGQADEDWPSVSADGNWLLHTDNAAGATALVRRDLKTGDSHTLSVDRVDFRQPTGQLQLTLKDAQTGDPALARVSVQQVGGKFHFPLGELYRITSGVGHFYAREHASLTVPSGRYVIQAWRGPEYWAYRETVEVGPGKDTPVLLALDRWVNMPQLGWYSGENHIHANYGYGAWHNDPRSIRDQCEGEDLHVSNVVVANSDGDGVFDRDYFLGRPDPLSTSRHILYWNEEFRSTIWGHLTLGSLSHLVEPIFTGFKETTNPWDVPSNAEIAERTRAQGGTVSYTHPASNLESLYDGAYSGKGLPVDAALGRVDTIDVMGSGYGASVRVWYRLLNCGIRLPAAAGTDVFLNRIPSYPPGWGRCYVRLTNALTYPDWIRGQKAGRSFVTSGPMLEWNVDGRESGQTLSLDGPRSLRVKTRISSQFPIKSLELIVNGSVVSTNASVVNEREWVLDQELKIERAGWISVRGSSANTAFPGLAQLVAHANPVYVDMPSRPFDASSDTKYFLEWIDRLEGDLKKRDRIPVGWERVKAQLDAARAFFK